MVASTVAAGITSSPSVDDAVAPSAEPVAPAEIEIRLEIHPEGAIVELDGIKVSGSSLHLPRSERAHTLVIRAPGYETERRSIEARADTVLSLSLRKQESPPRLVVAPANTARPTPPTPLQAPIEVAPPATPAKKPKGPLETNL